ncbi:MAG: hypothetical protein D6756_08830 [Cyanobacteria bacterium J083]|nr:MAG: hypothetical protein D6756_08830 [Cyanobacteria bacterium J083]
MNQNIQWLLPPKVALSLVTAPFLAGIILGEHLEKTLIELGEASEEIFRGERLPTLSFPNIDQSPEL